MEDISRHKYKQLMIAATSLRDDLLEGRQPTFAKHMTYKDGKPQDVGAHLLHRAGYVEPQFSPPLTATGIRECLEEFLNEAPPGWLLDVWSSMEDANDAADMDDTARMRYIVAKLNEMVSKIKSRIRP
jgi:hypothetical protein